MKATALANLAALVCLLALSILPQTGQGQAGRLFRAIDIPNGLVGYWKLDEAAGLRFDSSGRTNHLTSVGTLSARLEDYWGTGERSAEFELSHGEYLQILNGSEKGLGLTGSNFTIAAWIKRDTGSAEFTLCAKGGQGGNGYSVKINSTDGYELYINSTVSAVGGSVVRFPVGKWTHVAVSFDHAKNETVFYKDGNVVGVVVNADTIASNANDFRVGSRSDTAPTSFLDGLMKDLAVWNRALTPLEIKSLAFGVNLLTQSFRPGNIPDSLVSWWKLDETSSGSSPVSRVNSVAPRHLTDNGNIGSGPGYLEGAAADLDGTGDYFSTPDSDEFDLSGGKWTIACWIDADTIDSNSRRIFSQRTDDSNYIDAFTQVGGGVHLQVLNTGSSALVIADGVIRPGTWHHVAVTEDGNAYKIYIDGRNVTQSGGNSTVRPGNYTGSFVVGFHKDNSYFDGRIADFAIWKRALESNEIAALATGLPVQRAGIVSYWKMDELSGTRFDSMGTNHLADPTAVASGTGATGNAADFEGSNSTYLKVPASSAAALNLTNSMSFLFWFKPESSNDCGMIAKTDSNANGYSVFFGNTSQPWQLSLALGCCGYTFLSPSQPVNPASFNHVAVIFDGALGRGYFSSTPVAQGSPTAPPQPSTHDFLIGAHDGPSSFFDGLMDEVIVAKRWFRDEEIKAIYNRGLNGEEAFHEPTVECTSPTNGAKFTALGIVFLQATVTEPGYTITNVSFYAGTNFIGSGEIVAGSNVTAQLTWSNVPSASYTLTALATDSSGITGASAPINIEIVAPFSVAAQGSGTATASPAKTSYQVGETITLTATARNTNWTRFVRWSDGNTNSPRTITVGISNSYTAIFTNFVPLESFVVKQWERSFGGLGGEAFAGIQQTTDGGYILAAATDSGATGNKTTNTIGSADFWVLKLDAGGTIIWQSAFGGTGNDSASAVQQTSDGGFVVAGSSQSGVSGNKTSTNHGDFDYWIVKLDANGRNVWDRSFGGSGNDACTAVQQTSDGGYILGGYSNSGADGNRSSTNYGGYDFWVVKLDGNGDKQWDKAFGGDATDLLYTVLQASDGGYILGGTSLSGVSGNKTSGSQGSFDYWVVKLDSAGNWLWDAAYGGSNSDSLGTVQPTSDNGCILGGYSYSSVSGNKTNVLFPGTADCWLVKVDRNGTKLWEKALGGSGEDILYSIGVEQLSDGSYVVGSSSSSGVSGTKSTSGYGGFDYWFVQVDANGNKILDASFGGSGDDFLYTVRHTSDGGFILGGRSSSPPSGNKTSPQFGVGDDLWVVKLSAQDMPLGTPLIFVNGENSLSNTVIVTNATLALIEARTSFTNGHLFYTLDGSAPSSNSVPYSGAITLLFSATLRVIAYNSGYSASAEADPLILSVMPISFFVANIGNGTISRSPNTNLYIVGQQVTLTATPARYYTFLRWSDGNLNGTRTITIGLSNAFTGVFTNSVPLEEVVFKEWEQDLGGNSPEDLYGLQQTTDGGYIVGGASASVVSGNKTAGAGGYWIIKLDPDGHQLWDRSFGGGGSDTLRNLQQTSDGGYILGGFSSASPGGTKTSPNYGSDDCWVVKIDGNGNQLWDKSFGGTGSDVLSDIHQTSDGGFILGAQSYSPPSGNKTSAYFGSIDFWVIKLDASGNKIWENSFGGSDNDTLTSLQQTSDGGYIVGGISLSGISGNKTNAGTGAWLVKLDGNGNKVWEQALGSNNNLYSLQQTSDGGFIVGGWSGGGDYWVAKLDGVGSKIWERSFGGNGDDRIGDGGVRQTSDGGYIVGGWSGSPLSAAKTSPNYGDLDFWVLKLDSNGNKLWENSYGGSGRDTLLRIQQTTDGGYVFGGDSTSQVSGNKTSAYFGNTDYWVVKLGSRQVPLGIPVVLVNGQSNPTNSYIVTNATAAIVEIQSTFAGGHIFYTLDGSAPSSNSLAYSGSLTLLSSTTLRPIAYNSTFSAGIEGDPVSLSITPISFFLANNGSGSITASPNTNLFFVGQQVTLTATPRTNWWQFVRWSDGNTSNPRVITVGQSNSFAAIFTNIVPFAQLVSKQWEAAFGGTSDEVLASVAATTDGGYLLGGYSFSGASGNKTSGNFGGYDYWVVKLDANGSKQWETNYGGGSDDVLRHLAPTSDGGCILVGNSSSDTSGNKTSGNFGSADYWVVKLDVSGRKQWEANYGGTGTEYLDSLALTLDGGYLLGGHSASDASGNKMSGTFGGYDYWVVKLDANGSKQWETNYGGTSGEVLESLVSTSDGGCIVGGYSLSGASGNKTSGNFGLADYWVVKLDGNGSKQWEANYGGAGNDYLDSVAPTSDGGCIVGGYSNSGASGNKTSGNFGGYDYWVLKLDGNGSKQWETNYGGTSDDTLIKLTPTIDGGYILGGYSSSSASGNKTSGNFGGSDYWLVKLNANGSREWETNFGGTFDDNLYSLAVTSDWGYIVAGASQSGPSGNKSSAGYGGLDYWVVKLAVVEDPVPSISFAAPTNGAKFTAPGLVVINTTIGDFDGFVSNISFYATGTMIGTNVLIASFPNVLPGTNSYSSTWSNVVVGSYTIAVVASDNLGVSSTSAPVSIEIVAPFYLANQGSGTVIASPAKPSYQVGESVTLTAAPGRYYTFLRWRDGNTNATRTITVAASNNTYSAIFTNTVPLEEQLVFKQWEKSFGGANDDMLYSLQQTSDGGFIAGGGSYSAADGTKTSANFGSRDFYVVRLDSSGNKLWDRSYGGGGDDSLQSLQQTADGGFILGGFSNSGMDGNKTSTNFGSYDFYVVRLDANGNKLWDRSFGGPGNDQLSFLQQTSDAGFILGGESPSGFWVVRLDGDGNKLWERSYGGGVLTCGQQTADGGFIFGGWPGFQVVRVDANGTPLWPESFHGGLYRLQSLVQTANGGFMLAGFSQPSGDDATRDVLLIRLDSAGNNIGEQTYGGSSGDIAYSVRQTADGGFIVGGASLSGVSGNKSSPGFGQYDGWFLRLDAAGKKLWEQSFGGTNDDSLQSVQQTADSGYVLGGSSASGFSGNKMSTNYGGYDFWIVKLASREAPVGTPIVLVNGQYSLSNSFTISNATAALIEIQSSFSNAQIYYTLDGSAPSSNSVRYPGPFPFGYSTTIRAVAYTSNLTASAEADPVTLSLASIPFLLSNIGSGSVTRSPETNIYVLGQQVTLSAVPRNSSWTRFLRWNDGDTSSTRTITIGTSNAFTAIFTNTVPLEELVFKQWEKTYGGTDNDYCFVLRQTADGGFILGGYSRSTVSGNKTNTVANSAGMDCWIVKTDSAGEKQWERSFGGTGDEYITDILLTSDGGYLLVCTSSSDVSGNKTTTLFGGGGEDIWLIKLDANGNKQYEREFGGTGGDTASSGAVTADGGFVIAGTSDSDPGPPGNKTARNHSGRDMWLLKLDSSAQLVWDQSYGSDLLDGAGAVLPTHDGGYFLAGGFQLSANDRRLWTVKTDSTGATQWSPDFGVGTSQFPNAAFSARPTADDGFVVLGVTGPTTGNGKTASFYGDFDWWLIRLDSAGHKIWDKSFGGAAQDYGGGSRSVQIAPDGGFVMVGYSASPAGGAGNKTGTNYAGSFDGWVVRTDADGNKLWDLTLGGTSYDAFTSVEVLPDGYVLAGYTQSSDGTRTTTVSGGYDCWLVKLAARQAPVGTPVVLVNGQYSPSNSFAIPATNAISVTLTSTFAGAFIFYTLDGSDPDFNSTPYTNGSPFTLTESAMVRAAAYSNDGQDFEIADPVQINVIPLFNITNATPGGGFVTFDPPAGPYLSNSVANLTAVPSNGWTFMRWEDASGIGTNRALVMNGSKTIRAVFGTGMGTNATSGAGGIVFSPSTGPYPYGSIVRLIGIPASNKYFSRWFNFINGPTANPYDFTVTTPNTNITGFFSNLPTNNFTLTILLTGSGNVTRSFSSGFYTNGTNIALTANPDAGWVFASWSGDATSSANPLSVLMNTNKIVTANFMLQAPGNQGPVVTLTNPTNGASFVAPAIVSLSASAGDADGTVTRVDFFAGTTVVATATNAAPGTNQLSTTWTNVPAGSYSLTAVAVDNGGLRATSAPPVIVTVNPPANQAPFVRIDNPSDGASFPAGTNILISGSASDADGSIVRVEIFAGTNLVGVVSNASFSMTWSNAPAGAYALTARAIDNQGASTVSASVGITINGVVGPPVFYFERDSYSAGEADGVVTVRILRNFSYFTNVNFVTENISARAGEDYVGISGSLTFQAGELSKTTNITILEDAAIEPNETFLVALKDPTLSSNLASTVVTIIDNDTIGITSLQRGLPSSIPQRNAGLRVSVASDNGFGQWRLVGEPLWRAPDVPVGDLVAGVYELEFRPLTACVPPPRVGVLVELGKTNEFIGVYSCTGATVLRPLQVQIDPPSIATNANLSNRGGWRLQGDTDYHDSGVTTNVPVGIQILEYKPINTWIAPATEGIDVFATTNAQILLLRRSYTTNGLPPEPRHTPVPFASLNTAPYAFNGQIRSRLGTGSGTAVRERVVLTATHVLFDTNSLSWATDLQWLHQHDVSSYEPLPQLPRGVKALSGYSAQEGSWQSQNRDAAVMFFQESAARGGYSGYLGSDAPTTNEWLVSSQLKEIIGYPTLAIDLIVPGRMHVTQPAINALFSAAFNDPSNRVYVTSDLASYPGNSGGAIWVQHPNNAYYPAAICVARAGQTIVRAIDSEVVDLIRQAELASNGGTNILDPGIIYNPCPSCTSSAGQLQIQFQPVQAVAGGAAWRLSGYSMAYRTSTAGLTPGTYTIEFNSIAGFCHPANRVVEIRGSQIALLPMDYAIPLLNLDYADGLRIICGGGGVTYRIDYAPALLNGATQWHPLTTNTLSSTNQLLPNTRPPASGSGFYRAVRQ